MSDFFQASMLVAGLCLDYKIYDVQIWNGVLQQLVHFGLVRSSFVYCTSGSIPSVGINTILFF